MKLTMINREKTKHNVVVIILLLSMVNCFSVEAIEFNTDVLDSIDRNNIDLSRFKDSEYVMPGDYLLNIFLNNQKIGNEEQSILFYTNETDSNKTDICFPIQSIHKLGLTQNTQEKIKTWHQKQCADFSALNGFTIKVNVADGNLNLTIPKTYLEYSDSNWLPQSQWDNGINGFLVDYNLNMDLNRHENNGSSRNLNISGTLGANISKWRVRADYQGNYTKVSSSNNAINKFDWSRLYAFRAIPNIRSVITLGESFFQSNIFDSFRYTGVSLVTDERMLPPNLRGYAPEVRGIAKTNAIVTVTQHGRVIHETTVASGPFQIQDLTSAVSGKLKVKVQEQDGTEQIFYIDTANVPYLTRPGSLRYKMAIGRPSTFQHKMQGNIFASNEISWGVANSWSLYGGGIITDGFNSLSIGIGRDLFLLGALSIDVTQSHAQIPNSNSISGRSYRLSYSKRFDDYDSEVTFAGYRFSERDYVTMNQFLNLRYLGNKIKQNKEMYTVTLNKNFTDARLSLYTTYSHQSYWDKPDENNYSLSLSRYFDFFNQKNLSINISAVRSQRNQRTDDSISLGVSVPLGNGQTLGYNGQSSNNFINQAVNFTDNIDINNNYRVSIGETQRSMKEINTMVNGYYNHRNDIADISVNASYAQHQYRSLGTSIQGGFTATMNGAAFHPSGINGGTRLMLSTEGVDNIPINNGILHSNSFGIAVLTNINSYYRTDTSIDINKIADDVDVNNSIVESALTDGAIGFRKFNILRGNKGFVIIRLKQGNFPPFGASIQNEQGRELGIVGDNGLAYIAGFTVEETLHVKWNGTQQCQIEIPQSIQLNQDLLLPCTPSKIK
ncbi:fimbria/pilus outer membrane usher protein [Proteus vulgaris]|uniref:fimbria/pilus outer membrane usher protein n=1 Tax=Proteus vulgaris TaxID=585 RepID=UPI000C9F6761|nr:fimbria/pilus outer membrane usher protein [Proteus vulgaris]UBH60887.1 fimbria/pilus outer membrane usher protein [Proteus vulgaris]UWU01311.1 fimbria/pilus outer membrane usher protein [Proteus vulgaris]